MGSEQRGEMADLRATVGQGGCQWSRARAQAPTTRRQSEQRPGIKAPGSVRTEEWAAQMWGGAQSGQRAAGSAEARCSSDPGVLRGAGVDDGCRV